MARRAWYEQTPAPTGRGVRERMVTDREVLEEAFRILMDRLADVERLMDAGHDD